MATMADTSVKLQVNDTHLRSLSVSIKISNCKMAIEKLIAMARINKKTKRQQVWKPTKLGTSNHHSFSSTAIRRLQCDLQEGDPQEMGE